jgi:hypothetical protein
MVMVHSKVETGSRGNVSRNTILCLLEYTLSSLLQSVMIIFLEVLLIKNRWVTHHRVSLQQSLRGDDKNKNK